MSTLSSSFVQDELRLVHVLLAVGAALGDHRLDLVVLARVQRLEREVLELPLERVDAEPVRERRVDLERLARLLHLLLAAEVLDRAHVVEPVGELDQDDPDVLGHRDDHLPVVLGLGVLAALELDPRQLRDALDEVRDLVAELGRASRRRRPRCPRRRRGAARRRSSRRRACSSAQIFAAPNGWWMKSRPSGAPGPRAPGLRTGRRARAGRGRRRRCRPRPRRAAPRRDLRVVRERLRSAMSKL